MTFTVVYPNSNSDWMEYGHIPKYRIKLKDSGWIDMKSIKINGYRLGSHYIKIGGSTKIHLREEEEISLACFSFFSIELHFSPHRVKSDDHKSVNYVVTFQAHKMSYHIPPYRHSTYNINPMNYYDVLPKPYKDCYFFFNDEYVLTNKNHHFYEERVKYVRKTTDAPDCLLASKFFSDDLRKTTYQLFRKKYTNLLVDLGLHKGPIIDTILKVLLMDSSLDIGTKQIKKHGQYLI